MKKVKQMSPDLINLVKKKISELASGAWVCCKEFFTAVEKDKNKRKEEHYQRFVGFLRALANAGKVKMQEVSGGGLFVAAL